MKETDVEKLLKAFISRRGGKSYKFVSPGRVNVPDQLVLLPGGVACFIEAKRTGEEPRSGQYREHVRLRKLGFSVYIVDSKKTIAALKEKPEFKNEMVKRLEKPMCPYCAATANLVGGDEIYPDRTDLHNKMFWLCVPCKAYVGVKSDSSSCDPLGTLADAATRAARLAAHNVFDPIWRTGEMTRGMAYTWLADELGYNRGECHMSWMQADEAQKVVDLCTRRELFENA